MLIFMAAKMCNCKHKQIIHINLFLPSSHSSKLGFHVVQYSPLNASFLSSPSHAKKKNRPQSFMIRDLPFSILIRMKYFSYEKIVLDPVKYVIFDIIKPLHKDPIFILRTRIGDTIRYRAIK